MGILAAAAPVLLIISLHAPLSLNNVRYEIKNGQIDVVSRHFGYAVGEIGVATGNFHTRLKRPDDEIEATWRGRYPKQWFVEHSAFYVPYGSSFMGFSVQVFHNFPAPGTTNSGWGVFLPLWPFALIGAIPLLRRLARRWVTRERASRERCVVCGYDIRTTPDRCPECGNASADPLIAPDVGPAVLALAKSSGTKCIVLMAAYMTGTVVCAVWAMRAGSEQYYVLALLLLMCGSFHAAGYSRSIEAFFGCGAMYCLLLGPLYIYIGRTQPLWVQLAAAIGAAIGLGSLTGMAAAARWRWQDRVQASHGIRNSIRNSV
ncbi:MAG TPA: hypothetical protein VIM11_10380 [Tepidisphaeraceae bacterium]|jgi:hypothetical protein